MAYAKKKRIFIINIGESNQWYMIPNIKSSRSTHWYMKKVCNLYNLRSYLGYVIVENIIIDFKTFARF